MGGGVGLAPEVALASPGVKAIGARPAPTQQKTRSWINQDRVKFFCTGPSHGPGTGAQPGEPRSALGELEAAARTGLAVLLAFLDAGVTGQQTALLEHGTQFR